MTQQERELEQAWEELSFWRNYALWWSDENRDSPEPRIKEALDQARQRYAQACLQRGLQQVL